MKDYILNKVVLKTGDSLDIVESSTLPLTEKLMYKVEHEKDKIIVRRDGGKMVILSLPVLLRVVSIFYVKID